VHFGATLRIFRVGAGLSLRELAQKVGVSSAYLSRVEHGHDPVPTPDRLVAIAAALDLPAGALLDLARQAGPAVAGYLQRVPAAGALFLEIARRDLGAGQIARLRAFLDAEVAPTHGRKGTPAARPLKLGDLLSPARVILRLSCSDLADVVDVAVSRLKPPPDAELADRILAAERERPSALGNGVVAPHAVVPGVPAAAALVTLKQGLDVGAPDGRPARVAVVIVSPRGGRRHLEALAAAARLARYDAAADLCDAHTPARAMSIVSGLEALW
jgi:PTS system nitrogen regulatory IIA component